eukprot:gene5007-6099_t
MSQPDLLLCKKAEELAAEKAALAHGEACYAVVAKPIFDALETALQSLTHVREGGKAEEAPDVRSSEALQRLPPVAEASAEAISDRLLRVRESLVRALSPRLPTQLCPATGSSVEDAKADASEQRLLEAVEQTQHSAECALKVARNVAEHAADAGSGFDDLPSSLMMQVFFQLDYKDCVNAKLVSKLFDKISTLTLEDAKSATHAMDNPLSLTIQ